MNDFRLTHVRAHEGIAPCSCTPTVTALPRTCLSEARYMESSRTCHLGSIAALLSFFCSWSTSCRPSVTSCMMRPRRQHEGSTRSRVAARAHDFSSQVKLMNLGLLAGLHGRLDKRVDAKKLACTASLETSLQEDMSAAAGRKVPSGQPHNIPKCACIYLCMRMYVYVCQTE